MKKVRILKLLILSLLTPLAINAQEWEIERSIPLDQVPSSYSIDTEHNIYLGFATGSLSKYSKTGQVSPVYSLPNKSSVTLIEAQNNRKIFLFHRDIQRITILDRFSSVPKNYPLGDFEVYLANITCPAPDGAFWTLEHNPQRIKKIDPLRKSTLLEVQHALTDSIFFMRSYRNLLLVADENGVQILDLFGSLIGSLEIGKTSYIQIVEDELIANTEREVIKFDPYQFTILERTPKPLSGELLILSDLKSISIEDSKLVYLKKTN